MKPKKPVRIQTYTDRSGQFRWRALAGNNEIIAQSEAYTRPDSAVRGARRSYPTAVIAAAPTRRTA